jgi:molybdenum cofactor biosynthesis protein B
MMQTFKPYEEHRHRSPRKLRFMLYTVSSSRYRLKTEGKTFTDETMGIAIKLINEKNHEIIETDVIDDDIDMIREILRNAVQRDVDVIVFMGGTGLARRDVTIEAVKPLLDKEAEGFGEIFRLESYKEIGAAAALTRATAGVYAGRVVMCLPGSPSGVELALKTFLDELPHFVYLAKS